VGCDGHDSVGRAMGSPPLILLIARFSLAGILILGISAVRGGGWSMSWRDIAVFAVLGIATNALYLGLGYTGLQTVSAGLGGLVVSANPVFTTMLAALFLNETLTWRKVAGLLRVGGVGFIVWHRLSVGSDDWYGMLFTLASLASIVVVPSCSSCWRRRAACGSAMASRISPRAWCCCRLR
jgi:drug/metabolite transporter (DMT)-like permease